MLFMMLISLAKMTCLQSIFHISYLRGLFPDKHFKSMNIENLGEQSAAVLQTSVKLMN